MRRLLPILLIGAMIGAHAHGAGVLVIVAPAAPGGGWDQTARVMQQVLTAVEPGSSVQVENVPGAAGTIGLARFVSADRGNPDALLITGQVMASAIVMNHSPVTLAETTPIARLTGEYEVIVVPAGSKWQTLGELIDAFKAAPASVSWGGGSAGGTDDLLVRLIASDVGVSPNRANYIAFPGGGAALAALLGGQVTAGVSGYGEFAGQIAAGTLRMLAVSAPARVAAINAPTLREQGIALDLANWRGVVAPPGLTDAERETLTARVEHMARSAQWQAVLARHGWEDLLLTGPAFRQFLLAEQSRINEVLRGLESANTTRASAVRLTPMTLPLITLAALALLGLALVGSRRLAAPAAQSQGQVGTAGAVRDRSGQPTQSGTGQDSGSSQGQVGTARSRPFLLLIALVAHAFAMPVVGFVPTSATLFIVAARLFGSCRWIRDAAIGIATATALYLAFTQGLGLDLPADPITRWLRR